MTESSAALLRGAEAKSRQLSAEAAYYWDRHQPRYRYLLQILDHLPNRPKLQRILDVGMGFETQLLSQRFPDARVDVLGIYEDERYRPVGPFDFHQIDLNSAARKEPAVLPHGKYQLIVFMEVLEHLYTPPELVFRFLAAQLEPGGLLLMTTPNAAWLKNRLKMVRGRNPFERLKPDLANMGHVRESTASELAEDLIASGLRVLTLERAGLYHFNNSKDNFYSWLAGWLHPSLRRTLFALAKKPE